MEILKEVNKVKDTINKTIVSRLDSPFFGALIFSWVLYNWDIILSLSFGEANMSERINDAKENLNINHINIYRYLIPLVIAFSYLAFSPLVNYWIDLLQFWALESRKNKEAEAENAELDRKLNIEEKKINLQNKQNELTAIQEFQKEISGEFMKLIVPKSQELFDKELQDINSRLQIIELKTQRLKISSNEASIDQWDQLLHNFEDGAPYSTVEKKIGEGKRYLMGRILPKNNQFGKFIRIANSSLTKLSNTEDSEAIERLRKEISIINREASNLDIRNS